MIIITGASRGIGKYLFDAYSAKTNLTTAILITTLRNSPPLSVTMAERIDELRAWSRGRCVPADDLPPAPPTPSAPRP